jgi:formylglycine-generating enzyme required for sulfatase activity
MTEQRPLKVFLCHAHADRNVVRRLYARLTKNSVDAWLDNKKLLPGQDWEFEIRKAVREADVIVVCLSKQFNQAGFRQKEVRLALDTAMEKPEGEIFIIPARLEECDTLESLRKWHWVDLFKKDGYEMLTHALEARAKEIGAILVTKPPRKIGTISISIILIALLIGIFVINYAINNWPVAVVPTSTPMPGIGSTIFSEKDGMTLVFVPAGEFTMGSNLYSDEQPIHKVTLDSFWIDQTEVTNKMYALCVQARACQPPSSTNSHTRKDYYGVSEFDNYPVIYVDRNKAKTYCEWAGRRLPTEAEWEKAARGTDGRTYPWGNDAPNSNLLNYNKNVGDTTEVGKYPAGASIYSALDMAGNVWEWVSSLYQSYPYSASDGREDLNATGSRVLRGGAWYDLNSGVRSASRLEFTLNSYGYFGFRCVISQ